MNEGHKWSGPPFILFSSSILQASYLRHPRIPPLVPSTPLLIPHALLQSRHDVGHGCTVPFFWYVHLLLLNICYTSLPSARGQSMLLLVSTLPCRRSTFFHQTMVRRSPHSQACSLLGRSLNNYTHTVSWTRRHDGDRGRL